MQYSEYRGREGQLGGEFMLRKNDGPEAAV
jgi:hypothetical protein